MFKVSEKDNPENIIAICVNATCASQIAIYFSRNVNIMGGTNYVWCYAGILEVVAFLLRNRK